MTTNRCQPFPVYVQSFYVQGSEPLELVPASRGEDQVRTLRPDSGDLLPSTIFAPLNYVQTLTATSVPSISEVELRDDYQELGNALGEMTRFDADEEWKIERPVFETASLIASQLASLGIPAPQLFNHGSRSIVFNWSNRTDNLYLTISADKVSALLSSPEKIKRRAQLPRARISQSHLLVLDFRRNGEPVVIPEIVNSTPDFAS